MVYLNVYQCHTNIAAEGTKAAIFTSTPGSKFQASNSFVSAHTGQIENVKPKSGAAQEILFHVVTNYRFNLLVAGDYSEVGMRTM
jgi:hypothetical protein